MRRLLVIPVLVLALAIAWFIYQLRHHPSMEPYQRYLITQTLAPPEVEPLSLTFFGVSTALISDGTTALMTDGFFTRPPLHKLLPGAKIAPDPQVIARSLERADVRTLAAVLVLHSHFDHAMDAPEVARQTGALLVGSSSSANVGRGWGLPEEQIRTVETGKPQSFGNFTVTFFRSRHVPLPLGRWTLGQEITEPLVPPTSALAYKEGGSYSVLIEHPLGNILVQGSAGYVEGALAGRQADVVLLGIGALGRSDRSYKDAYFREIVEAVAAKRIIPIHYDDFTLPLDQPLRPFPPLFDDVARSMAYLIERTEADPGLRLELLPLWKKIALIEGG